MRARQIPFLILGAVALIASQFLGRSVPEVAKKVEIAAAVKLEPFETAREPDVSARPAEDAASRVTVASRSEPREESSGTPFTLSRWPASECRHIAETERRVACVGREFRVLFESEKRHEGWASSVERNILVGMAEINSFTTVTGLAVECRETVCRLHMAFPSEEYVTKNLPAHDRSALVREFFLPMLRQTGLQPLVVPYAGEGNVPERTYYFWRQ